MTEPVWSHPVFGSIPPKLRHNLAAKTAHERFLEKGEYFSGSGTFAYYHFLRCLEDNVPCKLELVVEGNLHYFKVSLVRNV